MTKHVILSGGLDSTVTLAHAERLGGEVRAISFDYGQRHRRELHAAREVAEYYRVPHRVIEIPDLFHGSALLESSSDEIPRTEYESESMGKTVVQGRNLLFTSLVIAQTGGGDSVWVGVHGGDHDLYPDCRPEFWQQLSSLAWAYGVEIKAPFLHFSKADIALRGLELGAPIDLTWSCYVGGEKHCGTCGTCIERRAAFELAGVEDQTEYAK